MGSLPSAGRFETIEDACHFTVTNAAWSFNKDCLLDSLRFRKIDPRDPAVGQLGLDAATQAARRMAKGIGIDFSIARTTTRRKRR